MKIWKRVCGIPLFIALCAILAGCSSSDNNGKVADLEGQLSVANDQVASLRAQVEELMGRADISPDDLAALRAQVEELMGRADISPDDLAALRAQVEELMGRADISPDDLAALRAEVEELMGRADISPENLADLRIRIEAAAQATAASQMNAVMANAVEKIAAYELRHELNPEQGRPEGTSGWFTTREVYAGSGSEFAALSRTHKYGDAISAAIPWRDESGELQFYVDASPVRGSLSDEVDAYTWRSIATDVEDRDGVTTSYDPTEAHGLGSEWHGFELTKAYDGDGTWRVRLFTDIEASDVLTNPYHDWDASEFDAYEHRIMLDDDRVPAAPGRDGLFVIIPEDGLTGSLDGVAGRFSCTGGYCSLNTDVAFSRYIPWFDSGVIRFTPADGSQSEVMLEIPSIRTASEIPKANYLSLGSWWYLPEGATGIDAYEFGVFAGGDDPFMGANLQGLAGNVSYTGKATGMYAETIRPRTESFVADVDLTAAFGSEGDLGRVTGRVSGFRLESGTPMPVSSLSLHTTWDWDNELWEPNIRASWDDGADFIPGGLIEGETAAAGGWRGEWGGRFFGNSAADPAAYPTSVAGTFGATDGTRSVAGSFGAHGQ